MSWDHEIKSIKCPCGKGFIEKDVASDDWGRIEEGKPVIKCLECDEKYKVATITYPCPYSWKGDTVNHYLVPKDIDLAVDYIKTYEDRNGWEVAKKSFSDALIVSYSKKSLEEALIELNSKTSVASLVGFASSMASDRKKWLFSSRIHDLRNDVREALFQYDSYFGNHEQLEMQRKYNHELEKLRDEKIKKYGIFINL